MSAPPQQKPGWPASPSPDLPRRRRPRRPVGLYVLVDALGVLLGLLAAYSLRFYSGIIEINGEYDPRAYSRLLMAAVPLWLFCLYQLGHYHRRERAFTLRILRRTLVASILAVMVIICVHFFQRTTAFSRLVYPIAVITVTFITGLLRLMLDRILANLRRLGRLSTIRALILGVGPTATALAQDIRRHGYVMIDVIGFVAESAEAAEAAGGEIDGLPVLGHFGEIETLLRRHGIDDVFIAQPNLPSPVILDFMLEAEREDVRTRVAPTAFESSITEVSVDRIGGITLYGLKQTPLRGGWLLVKRSMDIVISLAVLVIGAPLLLLIAVLVKATSRGPVIYRQVRIGLDGQPFEILKFRSMRTDAESNSGPVWARPDDDRVTPLGKLLRRTNLDELPQAWNVLRGDMSLVGPRPERPHFVEKFDTAIPRYMARHRVRCGITGWAQVNGLRGNTSIEDRFRYDLYYVENWSIWLDIKILILTLWATENAY